MKKIALWLFCMIFVVGCAGLERKCSSCGAENFGADWLVVQYRMDGTPLRCWKLKNTSISNESASDGIYWVNPNGNLTHISGWYNRVQVVSGDLWDHAARDLNVDLSTCEL